MSQEKETKQQPNTLPHTAKGLVTLSSALNSLLPLKDLESFVASDLEVLGLLIKLQLTDQEYKEFLATAKAAIDKALISTNN